MRIINKKHKKQLYLSLRLTNNTAKEPSFLILVNNEICNSKANIKVVDQFTKLAEYTIEYDELNNFEIRLTNKSDSDTIVLNDVIVEDVNIAVADIVIDGLSFTDKLSKCFVYTDTNNQVHNTHGFMHTNGSLKIQIENNILFTHWISSFL